uniref:Uncharacterized protein n=1 Tax=Caenorhabditis japonica TaxID=281687 RepID=A0A8R1HZN7_CAEJA
MFSFARDFFKNDVEKEEEEEEEIVVVEPEIAPVETPRELNFSDVITAPEDLDPEFRKDSDSGIESGSVEEMRLDDSEEDDEFEKASTPTASSDIFLPGAGDSIMTTPTKSRRPYWRKHDYGSSPEVLKPKKVEKIRKFGEDYDYRKFNDYVRSYRARSTHSVSEDARYSKFEDFVGSPSTQTDDLTTSPSLKVLSADRRTKSEETIWKPVLTKVRKTEFFRKAVERRGKVARFLRGLRLPVVVTFFLVCTTCSLIMVAINTFKLLFGFRSLPVYAQYIEVHTRHSFGLFGAIIETLIILYVMLTSFVGLYSLPVLRSLRPVRKDTPMPTIIINSSIVLVVSSALPVIVNTLGMTTFDLLGAHSSLQWLGNFRVVVAYNTLFVLLSCTFLFNQLTASMRRQIWKWICHLRCSCRITPDLDNTIVILRDDKKLD